MRKYLAIIPARGGSKGVPNKNIIDVCGKPLLQYTVDVCVRLQKTQHVAVGVVSTDSTDIAKVARDCGMQVPFMRPAELATDAAKTIDCVLHVLDFYSQQGQHFDAVMVLQPTSPLRTYNDVVGALQLFETQGVDSLISCYKAERLVDSILYTKDGDTAVGLCDGHNAARRRQESKHVYVRNGAIYIARVDYVRKEKKLISDRPCLFEMDATHSINIDTMDDLQRVKDALRCA